MGNFNPGGDYKDGETGPLRSANYMIALTWFERKMAKSGSDYLRCKFSVCAGPRAKHSFFSMLSLDLTKPRVCRTLQLICESIGQTEAFEVGLQSEGTQDEGDANIRQILVGKPFKARVKYTQNGQYENNDIDYILERSKWTPDEEFESAQWAREWQEKRDNFGDPEDQEPGYSSGGGWHDEPPPAQEYDPYAAGDPNGDQPPPPDDYEPGGAAEAPPEQAPDDDDIPF